jgi:hypothetical protein
VYEIGVPFFNPFGTLSMIVPVLLSNETKSSPDVFGESMIAQSFGILTLIKPGVGISCSVVDVN